MSEPEKNDPAEGAPQPLDLEAAIREKVIAHDPRYELGAYLFIYEALAYTQKSLDRDDPELEAKARHVTGQVIQVDGGQYI